MLPWVLCAILTIIVITLGVKLWSLQKGLDDIGADFREHLMLDTNTLISVSSSDRHIKRLANEINAQLRLLRKQRRQYVSGDRELKEAVTNISHDLRTPLTAICGYLDLLEGEEKSEAVTRYLSFIADRAETLKQLTEELFRYSVILSAQEGLHLETLDVGAVLEESLAAFYPDFTRRDIIPTVQMPDRVVLRILDKTAIMRVFGNILSNAFKYSEGDLDIILTDKGELTFSNTAADLDELQALQLFNRFYTVENARNSTGLGLAIAKRLMEQMRGEIFATCDSGRLSIGIRMNDGHYVYD